METALIANEIRRIIKMQLSEQTHKQSLGYNASLPAGHQDLKDLYTSITQHKLKL